MMDKRILVIGKGHLGSYLAKRWAVPSELHWKTELMDLTAADVKRLAPYAVVNTAGKTDLTWCENNTSECFRCNVRAPLHAYRAVKDSGLGAMFFHLSSGCIWDGPYREDGKPFQPTDRPTPACFYSWTKAACDSMLLNEFESPLLILRPRQVYSGSASPRDTLSKLNSYAKLLDTPNSMTSVETIAKTIEIMTERINSLHVMNVYDAGWTTPYRVGLMLASIGCRMAPEILDKADLDYWHKPKRVDAVIEDKLFEELVKPPHVIDQLNKAIITFATRHKYAGTKWTLMRQDDVGNAFVVEGGLERDAAEDKKAEFESHGHKQIYYLTKS